MGKNEPKEQRRRGGRQSRQPAGPVEKKPENQPEPSKPKEPEKPAYEPPGPEFYKSLKRETDEILKITEEANTKYKKKEIQSNWAKYEMPVETYEEIDDQDVGADYEKLIQAPPTTGSHFQFKHEKSWGTETGPSLYDNYFDINMDLLSLALSTIPFYERNNIETSLFHDNDIITMNHRATKFKQKYYNDKKYNTPELEAQDKILKSLTTHSGDSKTETINHEGSRESNSTDIDFLSENSTDFTTDLSENPTDKKDNKEAGKLKQSRGDTPVCTSPVKEMKETNQLGDTNLIQSKANDNKVVDKIQDLEDTEILFENKSNSVVQDKLKDPEIVFTKVEPIKQIEIVELKPKVTKEVTTPKNPVIESPEDLEKWLDDFLDG